MANPHIKKRDNSKQTMNNYGSFVCAGIILFKCIVLILFKCIVLSCMCNYQRLCSVLYKQYSIYAGFISSKSLSSFVGMCMKLFEPSLFCVDTAL